MTRVAQRSVTVRGGVPVTGTVTVAGFKHALVLAVAYAVGAARALRLANVPDILETEVCRNLLAELGVEVTYADNVLSVDASGDVAATLPASAGDIHGSLYLLPALLARNGVVRFRKFGGCPIGEAPGGERPWRHIVAVAERFGATCHETGDEFALHASRLVATELDLTEFTTDPATLAGPQFTGAVKAAILTAAFAEGTSVLTQPYLKLEVRSLLELLAANGVGVESHGDRLAITGVGNAGVRPLEHRLPADLMEVATWTTIAAITGGSMTLKGLSGPDVDQGLAAERGLWTSAGLELDIREDELRVNGPGSGRFGELPPIEAAARLIYSDTQTLFAVLATRCPGVTTIVDSVWTTRYGYVDGLLALGGLVERRPRGIGIGYSRLRAPASGVDVVATDLRCAAALLCAALITEGGPVTIHNTHHLHRGYDGLLDKLATCDADVARDDT
jgi:UDP-N-acetylglucosamine 1-carboxyvinyltransferase